MSSTVDKLEILGRELKQSSDILVRIRTSTAWRELYTSKEIEAIELEADQLVDMLDHIRLKLVFLLPKYNSPTIGSDSRLPNDMARLRAELLYVQPRLDIVASKTIGRE